MSCQGSTGCESLAPAPDSRHRHPVDPSWEGKSRVEDEEEQLHFEKIVNSFKLYGEFYLRRLHATRQFCRRMPPDQQRRLTPYTRHLNEIEKCINFNSSLMQELVKDAECMFLNRESLMPGRRPEAARKATEPSPADMEKTACVLRQVVREWSHEGREERSQSFSVILDAIERHLGSRKSSRRETRVLVPGAGLGRLVFEVAKRGFAAEGNEYSMFMLIASHFIINKCRGVDVARVYPFVHQMNNVLNSRHQTRVVSFPDEDPSSLPPDVSFSMTAGNFVDVYSSRDQLQAFDCIATCFFLDTGRNVLQYIETIRDALVDQGIWVNLGPLLYHFSEVTGEDSIEPSYDILRTLVQSYGFELLEERLNVPCCYTQNPDSMLSYVYRSAFFVARKVPVGAISRSDVAPEATT